MSGPRATLRLAMGSAKEAERVAAALRADDDVFVTTRRDGATLRLEARADAVRPLLRAIDDVLACASVAEAVDAWEPSDDVD